MNGSKADTKRIKQKATHYLSELYYLLASWFVSPYRATSYSIPLRNSIFSKAKTFPLSEEGWRFSREHKKFHFPIGPMLGASLNPCSRFRQLISSVSFRGNHHPKKQPARKSPHLFVVRLGMWQCSRRQFIELLVLVLFL